VLDSVNLSGAGQYCTSARTFPIQDSCLDGHHLAQIVIEGPGFLGTELPYTVLHDPELFLQSMQLEPQCFGRRSCSLGESDLLVPSRLEPSETFDKG
jgi:hypothetical protein